MLTNLIPEVYTWGQEGDDLLAVLRCVEEHWSEVDSVAANIHKLTQFIDSTTLVTEWLDHRGNPFTIDALTVDQKKLLTGFLMWAHKNRGQRDVIKQIARGVLGLDIDLVDGMDDAWCLGKSKLGAFTYALSPRRSNYLLVVLKEYPGDAETAMLRSVVEYIKPVTYSYQILLLDGGFGLSAFGETSFGG